VNAGHARPGGGRPPWAVAGQNHAILRVSPYFALFRPISPYFALFRPFRPEASPCRPPRKRFALHPGGRDAGSGASGRGAARARAGAAPRERPQNRVRRCQGNQARMRGPMDMGAGPGGPRAGRGPPHLDATVGWEARACMVAGFTALGATPRTLLATQGIAGRAVRALGLCSGLARAPEGGNGAADGGKAEGPA
jgi:hypothetical protein